VTGIAFFGIAVLALLSCTSLHLVDKEAFGKRLHLTPNPPVMGPNAALFEWHSVVIKSMSLF